MSQSDLSPLWLERRFLIKGKMGAWYQQMMASAPLEIPSLREHSSEGDGADDSDDDGDGDGDGDGFGDDISSRHTPLLGKGDEKTDSARCSSSGDNSMRCTPPTVPDRAPSSGDNTSRRTPPGDSSRRTPPLRGGSSGESSRRTPPLAIERCTASCDARPSARRRSFLPQVLPQGVTFGGGLTSFRKRDPVAAGSFRKTDPGPASAKKSGHAQTANNSFRSFRLLADASPLDRINSGELLHNALAARDKSKSASFASRLTSSSSPARGSDVGRRTERLRSFCSTLASKDASSKDVEGETSQNTRERRLSRVGTAFLDTAALMAVQGLGRSKRKRPRYVDPKMENVTTLRSMPMRIMLHAPRREGDWPLPISSISEQQSIELIGTDDCLEADLGRLQQKTLTRLARSYPKGSRITSTNCDPLQCWRGGVQMVAMNQQTNDLPMQLHRALFQKAGGKGYVLKPAGLRRSPTLWPPYRPLVSAVTLRLLSLHHLPVKREARPDYASGAHHGEVSKLSGFAEPPSAGAVSSPSLIAELFAIGGECCASPPLPPKEEARTRFQTPSAPGNGLNPSWGHMVHCVAAEPDETILRLSVSDGDTEVAYECVLVGVLRPGYRCIPLRSKLGTRIELCYLVVHISLCEIPNPWAPAYGRQDQRRNGLVESQVLDLQAMVRDKFPEKARKDAVGGHGDDSLSTDKGPQAGPTGERTRQRRPSCDSLLSMGRQRRPSCDSLLDLARRQRSNSTDDSPMSLLEA